MSSWSSPSIFIKAVNTRFGSHSCWKLGPHAEFIYLLLGCQGLSTSIERIWVLYYVLRLIIQTYVAWAAYHIWMLFFVKARVVGISKATSPGDGDTSTSIPCRGPQAQSWYLCQMLGNVSGAIWETPQAQETETHPQVPLPWDQSQRLCQVPENVSAASWDTPQV